MNLALWIVQIVVGAGFLLAGVMKATRPVDELAKRMKWVTALSPSTVRFIGVPFAASFNFSALSVPLALTCWSIA